MYDDLPILLLVDDDPHFGVLVRYALEKSALGLGFRHVCNGREMMEYLEGSGAYSDRQAHPLPKLLVLDLEMPGMTGLQALEWLRNHSSFHDLPVLMLTGSDEAGDRDKAIELRVSSYAHKPMTVEALTESLLKFIQDIDGRIATGGGVPSETGV